MNGNERKFEKYGWSGIWRVMVCRRKSEIEGGKGKKRVRVGRVGLGN